MRLPRLKAALGAAALTLAATPALAHPHVFVDARLEIVFNPAGEVVALRHVWRFDDAFSAFASQGLDADGDGTFSREELAPLAKVNVESLKDFGYFTTPKLGGKQIGLKLPTDYWLQMDDGFLTLFYTLPLITPMKPGPRAFQSMSMTRPISSISNSSRMIRHSQSRRPPAAASTSAARARSIPPPPPFSARSRRPSATYRPT